MDKEAIRQAVERDVQRQHERIAKFVEELHAECFGTIEKG